jgi:hypothetical protein
MTEELVKRLRSGLTHNNQTWPEMCTEAADAIEGLQAQVERLTFDGIHTCHDDCPRLPCVQRREIDALRAENRHLTNELQAHKDALAQAAPKP